MRHLRVAVAPLLWTLAACASGARTTPAPAPAARPAAAPAPARPTLLSPPAEDPRAPDVYAVRFETTKGAFTVEVHRDWAPRGADRLYDLVQLGYYDGARFYRVLPHFMAQFGFAADPAVTAAWAERTLPDDPVRVPNERGAVSFATAGPDSRTTQLFVNTKYNVHLDRLGFAPVGRVVDGMSVVDSLDAEYGEGPPEGRGPEQDAVARQGEAYLARAFPRLDVIRSARLVALPAAPTSSPPNPPDR